MLGGLGIFFQFELQRKFSNNIRAPQLHKNLPAFSRGIYQQMHTNILILFFIWIITPQRYLIT